MAKDGALKEIIVQVEKLHNFGIQIKPELEEATVVSIKPEKLRVLQYY